MKTLAIEESQVADRLRLLREPDDAQWTFARPLKKDIVQQAFRPTLGNTDCCLGHLIFCATKVA